jgi:DNA-directed RNA polymerase subunit RPC12/RpoP
MAYPYEEPANKFQGTQTRWKCDECRREFVDIWDWPEATREKNCPACGSESIHRESFDGLFDIGTDYAQVARLLLEAGVTEAQLRAEAEKRAHFTGGFDGADPSPALLASVKPFEPGEYIGG